MHLFFNYCMFSMAANNQFPLGIGAGGGYNGGGQPSISGPQAGGRVQPMELQFGQGLQPQPPTLSGAAGFQYGSGTGTQADHRMGRGKRSSTVRPS